MERDQQVVAHTHGSPPPTQPSTHHKPPLLPPQAHTTTSHGSAEAHATTSHGPASSLDDDALEALLSQLGTSAKSGSGKEKLHPTKKARRSK